MKLKAIFAASAAALLAQTSPALAQAEISLEGVPADELAVADNIILVMFPLEEREAIFRDMMQEVASQFAEGAMKAPVFEEPGIRAIMEEFLDGLPERLMPIVNKHMPSMLKATAVAYTREFSLEELEAIYAFSQTDAGSHYFRKATSLLSDPAVAASNAAYFEELQAQQGSIREEMQAKLMEFLLANPDVVERIQQRAGKAN